MEVLVVEPTFLLAGFIFSRKNPACPATSWVHGNTSVCTCSAGETCNKQSLKLQTKNPSEMCADYKAFVLCCCSHWKAQGILQQEDLAAGWIQSKISFWGCRMCIVQLRWAELVTGFVVLSPNGMLHLFAWFAWDPENHSQALRCSGERAKLLHSFEKNASNPNTLLQRDRLITSVGFASSGSLCCLSAGH